MAKKREMTPCNPPAPSGPVRSEPGERNKAAMAAAAVSWRQRPMRVAVNWEKHDGGDLTISPPHADVAGWSIQLRDNFGTSSGDFTSTAVGNLEYASRGRGERVATSAAPVNASLALVGAIAPQDELEAALAVQMAQCHSLATEMMGRARHADGRELLESYTNLAVKLQRTFTTQIEALARMRGKGQQTVRVEHVTVQAGAQAIVGDVHHHQHKEHRNGEIAGAAASAALPSPDARRDGVPLALDAERPLPDARRKVDRPAKGKPKRAQARPLHTGGDQ